MKELKPCPFCGSAKYVEHKREGAGNWRVACTADGCGASCHGQTRNRLGSRDAWNRRAPSDAMRKALEKVLARRPHTDDEAGWEGAARDIYDIARAALSATPAPSASEEVRALREALEVGRSLASWADAVAPKNTTEWTKGLREQVRNFARAYDAALSKTDAKDAK